ncbi:S41 family peptidase [Flavobacterium cerinum]|uniref:S41 family peptidase n=1 Tax=Flavobacterium cerinum TaxID=2502784 RepID=A0ABY5IP12_9FLAO|nr:S41 family peptidase [Flavobacterium cerinum]UUC44580.1 S41 family peptidase [Flavobacterium cerinum]
MKYITILSLFITSHLWAQSTKISDDQLVILAKVWGVMKYYHPAVSQGKVDWDKTLINTLESPFKRTDNEIITEWLEMADKTSFEILTPSKATCDSITFRNFDSKWIEKSRLNTISKTRLLKLINQNQNIGTYYSNPTLKSIRLDSQKEKIYEGFSANVKLLELFRIWNAVTYFYPYKYLLDTHWDKVLKKYIPIFKNIQNEQDYKLAITLLAAEIQDTHTGLKDTHQYAVFGKLTAPFTIQIVDNGALITGIKDEKIMQKANIKVGDFITKINGKKIHQIIAEKSKYYPASNQSVQLREAYNYLFSGNEPAFTIEGTTEDGKTFKTNVERMPRTFAEEWDKDGIPNYKLTYKGKSYDYLVWNADQNRLNPVFRLEDKAYVEFSSLRAGEIDSLMCSFQNTKGIVFDLRSYNDNGALLKVFDHLLSKPQFFGIKTQPEFDQPGKFCFVDYIITKEYKLIGKENPDAYKGRVIVLINEYTQSAAELWAMIFKKVPNVIFVGSQTAGADGNMVSIKLTDGNALYFSGLGIYYPDGTETQRIGIKPDIVVRPTLKSIRNKADLLLEKAFQLIDEQKK